MASGQIGFKVEGLAKVVRGLQALGLDVEDLKAAFGRISRDGARAAESYAPKASGRLAASVRGNRAKSKAVVFAGRASVPYAAPINYGWPSRNIAGSNFMQKADEDMRPKAIQILEEEINAAAKKRGLK